MRLLTCRSIWISDIHLGMRDCKADLLIEFLDATESDYLYLVGDIIDLENMRNGWYWPPSHNMIVKKLISKAKRGTRMIYIPGNHDMALRSLAGGYFGTIAIAGHVHHETKDGRRLLIIHGDEFDRIIRTNALLDCAGSASYELVQMINRGVNGLRVKMGYPQGSLVSYFKSNLKQAARYIERFEEVAAREAKRRALDGLVCGHIHKPALHTHDGILYGNDGDWVENCSALVESHNGRLQLIHWLEERERWNEPSPAIAA